MQAGTVRLTTITVLLASILVAAFSFWNLEQRAAKAVALAGDASARIARIVDAITGIGTAQQGYVAPGQLDEPWVERTSTLTSDLFREIQLARESLRSPQAPAALDQLKASVAVLQAADARARENLQLGQDLMAADVIFSDGRNVLDAMTSSLRTLQAAEQTHLRADLAARTRQRWTTLGVLAAVWLACLILISVVKTKAPSAAVTSDNKQPTLAAVQPSVRASTTVDLAAAAAVCTDLSRITTTAALPGLLARAAGVLDASGMIVWVGAGEQLFPVMAHGYPDDVLPRLGPIGRNAENAAARSWRTGQLTVVSAALPAGQGAIVTPLFGLHGCIGVLSAEVRQGETDPALQAMATVLAAQLSTVVPAWPAGSSLTPGESAASSQVRSA